MVPLGISTFALLAGVFLPQHWGISGFLGTAALLFTLQAGINFASGFAGSSIEESLLLFNGSWLSYLGFNLQITYRAFALPLLALAVPFIFRLTRART